MSANHRGQTGGTTVLSCAGCGAANCADPPRRKLSSDCDSSRVGERRRLSGRWGPLRPAASAISFLVCARRRLILRIVFASRRTRNSVHDRHIAVGQLADFTSAPARPIVSFFACSALPHHGPRQSRMQSAETRERSLALLVFQAGCIERVQARDRCAQRR